MPRRWSGKTAALLPTWPKATEDWIESSSMGDILARPDA